MDRCDYQPGEFCPQTTKAPLPSLPLNLSVRILNEADLDAANKLEVASHEEMGNAYCPLTRDEMLEQLSQGFSLGCFVNSELVAAKYCRAGIEINQFLAKEAGFDPTDIEKCLEFRGIIARKDYRGTGIANMLFRYTQRLCHERGFHHFFTSIAMNNYASLKVVLGSGFKVVNVSLVYGKSMRFIVRYDISSARAQESPDYSNLVAVPFDDLEEHQSLLTRGFIGISVRRIQDSFAVCYIPLKGMLSTPKLVANS
jgi:ribosomal protein S18 acetylase RimI-like enzyme